MTDSDPMHRALSDAEASDEAAAYTVPVELVRSRVRRRRAVRAGGAVGVAALAVVAVVVATPSFLSRTPAADPPDGPPPGVVADWPAQFDRCGALADEGKDTKGVVTLAAAVGPGASGTVDVHTTASAPARVDEGWVYGTDLSVIDTHGRVVGVQEGPTVPALDQVDAYYAGTDFAAVPFPVDLDEQRRVVSCEQYPDGEGAVDLPPGTYTLQVTQTLGYIDGGRTVPARASTEVPFVLDADGAVAPAASDPDPQAAGALFTCSAPVGVTIHTLPDAAGLTLAADLPATGWGSKAPEWSVTLGAADGRMVKARTAPAGSLALVDDSGAVAGFVQPGRGPLRESEVGITKTEELAGPTLVVPCGGTTLHGTYTAWPFVVATVMSGAFGDYSEVSPGPVVVVANPREITFGP
jgi:hypothetical protein